MGNRRTHDVEVNAIDAATIGVPAAAQFTIAMNALHTLADLTGCPKGHNVADWWKTVANALTVARRQVYATSAERLAEEPPAGNA